VDLFLKLKNDTLFHMTELEGSSCEIALVSVKLGIHRACPPPQESGFMFKICPSEDPERVAAPA